MCAVCETVACSIVASRLDYCNAMLYGAPAATFDVLQQAQKNLATVVCQHGSRTDTRPLLRSLHWLPMKQQVTYKMVTLTFNVLLSSASAYLCELIHPAVPVRPLWRVDKRVWTTCLRLLPDSAQPRIRTHDHWIASQMTEPHGCWFFQVSLPCNILLRTQLLYNLPLTVNDISLLVSNDKPTAWIYSIQF